MLNLSVFPSFTASPNATTSDLLFLDALCKTRKQTNAKHAGFMVFDYDRGAINQQNYVTYPYSWISNYVVCDHRTVDPTMRTDFRSGTIWNWKDLNWNGPAQRLLDDIERHQLGRNGVLVAKQLLENRYGVLLLLADTPDEEWRSEMLRHRISYERECRKVCDVYLSAYCGKSSARYSVSKREIQCLEAAALGKTDREIAEQLGLSYPTIVSHLKNAKRKLATPNRAAAVAVALTEGLISI